MKTRGLERWLRFLLVLLGIGIGLAVSQLGLDLFRMSNPDMAIPAYYPALGYAGMGLLGGLVLLLLSRRILRRFNALSTVMRRQIDKMPLHQLLSSVLGLILGLVVAALLRQMLSFIRSGMFATALSAILYLTLGALGYGSGKRRSREVIGLLTRVSGAREKYLAEGFDDYLSKPILGEQLESLLRRYLPPEKLEIVRDASPEPETDAGPEQADPYALLRAAGILPETGIMYCGNDEAFWQEMLRTYASEYTKKSIQLENCFRGKDWDGYMILVHSIKSTSLTVGAEALSVKAAAAEAAAAEKDEASLSSGYPELSEAYHHTAETIVRFFGEITDPSESSGILEFSPENPAGKG